MVYTGIKNARALQNIDMNRTSIVQERCGVVPSRPMQFWSKP